MTQKTNWIPLGGLAPARLAAARIELHWAAQVLAASADTTLERSSDDSHTNLFWDSEAAALIGRPLGDGIALGLRPRDATLATFRGNAPASEFALAGQTLAEALAWASAAIESKTPLAFRDYDMPAHQALQNGGTFSEADGAHAELGHYYDAATDVLGAFADSNTDATPIAVWPHHFDLGGIVFLEEASERAKQIGFGLSPGDGTISEPYFYVTPWPIAEEPALPPLAIGGWQTEGFTGAVLRASEIISGASETQRQRIETFIESAMTAGRRLIGEPG